MHISTEDLKQDLNQLTNDQLQQVADFIAFLKFQDKRRRRATLLKSLVKFQNKRQQPVALDPSQLADLASKFAQEDCALAELGMSDYVALLDQEDHL